MSSNEDLQNKSEDTVIERELGEGFTKLVEKTTQTLLPQIIDKAISQSVEPRLTSMADDVQKLQQSSEKLDGEMAALKGQLDKASPPKLIELAETSFKTVLDADYHLDDKASRILSAMAFLTAAAAAIFAKAYSPSLPNDYQSKIASALSAHVEGAVLPTATDSVLQSLKPSAAYVLGLDVSLLSFIGYIFFILIGAALYLAALGPALNKPVDWFKTGSGIPKSRLFYDFIGIETRADWEKYWVGSTTDERKQKPEQLQTKIEDDYIFETRLIAEKARGKYLWMSIGSVCFRIAILFLIPLVASLFSSDLKIVRLVSAIGTALIIGVYVFERFTRPSRPQRKKGSSLFRLDDFVNADGLIGKLKDGKDPLSIYLLSRLPATSKLLEQYTPPTKLDEGLRKSLVDELNGLLKGVSLYEVERFKDVQLAAETQELIKQNPQGKELLRLNRLLLEDAYPGEIVKGRGKEFRSWIFWLIWTGWLIAIEVLLVIYLILIIADVRLGVFALLAFVWGTVLSIFTFSNAFRVSGRMYKTAGLLFVILGILSLAGFVILLWNGI